MYAVGDHVVYPMHGAGVVETVEKVSKGDGTTEYLILSMSLGNMKVKVPMESLDKVGIRPVIGKDALEALEKTLSSEAVEDLRGITWNRRFTIYMEKMKKGGVNDLGEVISMLSRQDRRKKLSTGERRLLTNARQILASELMLVLKADMQAAEAWIEKGLNLEDEASASVS